LGVERSVNVTWSGAIPRVGAAAKSATGGGSTAWIRAGTDFLSITTRPKIPSRPETVSVTS
jgi:hypothetical protein